MLNIEKMKSAAYIQERTALKKTYNKDIKGQWLTVIKMPDKYNKLYFDSYQKNEEDFFCCLEEKFILKDKDWKWTKILEDLLDNWERLAANKANLSEKLLEHPFFVFANIFALYMEEKAKFENDLIALAGMEQIAMLVLENATKVLLEELRIFKEERNDIVNSDECYRKYCSLLKQEYTVRNLIYKYPLMFRIIIEQGDKVVYFYKWVEENYVKDYEELRNRFNISGQLLKIENNVGDSHRGKQQVLIFHFENGKILFKPRNLGVDEKFTLVIDYVNSQLRSDLKYAKAYNCGQYGWQEFITSKECNSVKEVETYYYKLGVFTGIFYLLMASDMHMENIVSCSSDPYFIDLESIFQCYKGAELNGKDSYVKITKRIRDSVLSTCLFPGHMNPTVARDVSGVTGCGGQKVPRGKYVFENAYTADMRIVRKDYISQDKKNIPILNGKRVNPRDYLSEIIRGFSDMYNLIEKNKKIFIKKDGLIDQFFDLPVRTILRDTASYGVLLKASTEPKYMSNAIMRNQLFDRLWLMVESKEEFQSIVPYEIDDLLLGDIPYFFSYINSSFLYNSKGEIIKGYKIIPMHLEVKKRIMEMGDFDKNFQLKLIQESMAKPIKRWELKENKKDYSYVVYGGKDIISRNVILEECKKIVNEIESVAFTEDELDDIGWIDLRVNSGGQWAFLPMDNTLYEGILGIGVVLAQLYAITREAHYINLVQKIINASEKFNKKYRRSHDLSAFNGSVSTAYSYYFIGEILKEQALKSKAVSLLLECTGDIKNDSTYDIISGSAGALIVAIRIWEKQHIDSLLDFAIKCGNHLLENVEDKGEMYGWYTVAGNNVVLAGMSHGNAGISWALMELYKVTNNNKYFECAIRAIEYENTLYCEKDQNWTDLRNRDNRIKKGFPEPVNWCHGAPGIGLSRIFCKKINSSCVSDVDIEHSIEKTIKEGFGGSDCLCHGSFGNLEVLLEAYKYYNDNNYLQYARSIASDLITEAQTNGWICGIPQRTLVPGLMTGLSGIVYGLLRICDPISTPNVLAFELPGGENEKA